MPKRVAIIGVGNTLMGDDGVGVRVAETLAPLLKDVDVTTGHLAGMALMPAVLAADRVYFVDAVATHAAPGTVYRLDPDASGISGLRSTTSHGMGIPYLITNSRLQGHHPEFVVYGVEIGDIMCGPDMLTDEVAAAVPDVVRLIRSEIDALAGHS